jgi:hypothetical protein
VTPQEQAAARVRERTAELVAEIAAAEEELARRLQSAPQPAAAKECAVWVTRTAALFGTSQQKKGGGTNE